MAERYNMAMVDSTCDDGSILGDGRSGPDDGPEHSGVVTEKPGKERNHLPLQGLNISIVGHPGRESDYRKLVETLGGELIYADARAHLGKIPGVVSRSDGVLFLSGYGSHKALDRTLSAARYYDRPVVRLHQSGLESVERAIRDRLLPAISQCVAA